MSWYVLCTNPKSEKKVAESLRKINIECYCPTQIVVKQWSDRKKKVEVPLFNSYIFVRIDEKDRDSVFQVRGIVKYLYWLGKPAIVRQEEIDSINNFVNNYSGKIAIEPLKPGDQYLIENGVFKGNTGKIQSVNNQAIRLILDSLGVVLSIETP